MINKYRLWNIAVFGGGGGDGGDGSKRDTSLDNPDTYSSPIGPGLPDSPDQTAKTETDNQARAEAIGQPPATTSFGFGPVPDGAMPTGAFSTANNPNLTLDNSSLVSANSGPVASAALAAMGATPSPQMAADLAAMGGVPAPVGTPMPTARPDFAPEYSNVDFTDSRSLPSFARNQSMIDPLITPYDAMVKNNPPSIMDYKTANQALDQAAMQEAAKQSKTGFDSLTAFANGEKQPTMVANQTPPAPAPDPEKQDIMSKIMDMVITPAKAEEMPPQAPITPVSYPSGMVPMPIARPVDLTTSETPPEPAPAPTPFPIARPASLDDQLKTSVVTPPAPTTVSKTTPFEDTLNKIVNDAPKNLTNAAVGFVPGVGIANTISGLFGGPTVGGAMFPGTAPTTTTSNPIEGIFNGISHTLGDLFGGNPTKNETINAYESRFSPSVQSAINGSYLNGVPNSGLVDAAMNGPAGPVGNTNANAGGGKDVFIPPIAAPSKVTSTTIPNTSTTNAAPYTLASDWGTKYLGEPNNLLRYGYGPEKAFYAKAAKGGAVGPLNMMMRKP